MSDEGEEPPAGSQVGATDAGEGDAPQEDGDDTIGGRIAKDPIELGFLVPLPETPNISEMPRVDNSR